MVGGVVEVVESAMTRIANGRETRDDDCVRYWTVPSPSQQTNGRTPGNAPTILHTTQYPRLSRTIRIAYSIRGLVGRVGVVWWVMLRGRCLWCPLYLVYLW